MYIVARMKTLANTISYIFHPLFMPVLAMAFYLKFMFFLSVKPIFYNYILFVMIICTILFPLMGILLLKSSKVITSMHMPSKEERRWPLLMGTAFFFLAYVLVSYVSPAKQLNYITMAGIATLTICTVVNLLYKLSIHMAAVGGITGMMVAYAPMANINMTYIILAAVFISGLVGFARLQLSAHSTGQVAAGYAAGFFSQYILLSFLSAGIL
jgi:hypothetical protein